MNRLKGIITAIDSAVDISLVTVVALGDSFSALVIDTPETAEYLQPGQEITIIFKETEMSLGKNLSGHLSLRNRFAATITSLEAGKILTRVNLNYKGQSLCAIITTRSAQELDLNEGEAVVGLVKSNEISLMLENN
jgi:molybdate transport system regulatory protein